MKTTTQSKVLLTTFILLGMSPSCWLMSSETYRLFGIFLLVAGLALLAWVWWPKKSK